MRYTCHSRVMRSATVAVLASFLAACAVATPRTDDPLQTFNRKMFAFNQVADKVAIRPAAKAYVKITGPKERVLIDNFFANLGSPVTIINDVLQARPGPALETTGRFVVNTTVGFLGLFDPASAMRLPANTTDFGVTLAHWGVPEGPYLVLPFIGPTTARDAWELPVDSYIDPLGWYARNYSLAWHAQYLPSAVYLVTLRANVLPLDKLLASAYDPYVFLRDAYRQHRLYEIYHGNPPLSAMEELQGTSPGADNTDDIERMLEQQHAYEKTHGSGRGSTQAPPSSTPPPPHAGRAVPPAPAAAAGS